MAKRKTKQPTIGDFVSVTWNDITEDSHADNPDDVTLPEFITRATFLGYAGKGKDRRIRLAWTMCPQTGKPYGVLAIPAGNILSVEVQP